jgi:hypothetical protein
MPSAPTAEPEDPTQEAAPATRRWTRRGPIWIRLSVITGLLLVGVFLTTMLLAAAGVGERTDSGGGGHGSDQPMEMDSDGAGGDHGSGGNHGSGGDRRSDEDHGNTDGPNPDHDPDGNAG